jgi:nitroreductase
MKETLQDIRERRSCRKFQDRQISDEQLNTILEAGTWAATGRGLQSPIMIVVQDKPTLEKLSKMNAVVMGVDSDPFYGAPTYVIVLADRARPTCVEDGSLVMGNLLNAAHSLGLGSCYIFRAKEVFETAEGKALLRRWGLKESLVGIGNCILGYPAEGALLPPSPRKEGYILHI